MMKFRQDFREKFPNPMREVDHNKTCFGGAQCSRHYCVGSALLYYSGHVILGFPSSEIMTWGLVALYPSADPRRVRRNVQKMVALNDEGKIHEARKVAGIIYEYLTRMEMRSYEQTSRSNFQNG